MNSETINNLSNESNPGIYVITTSSGSAYRVEIIGKEMYLTRTRNEEMSLAEYVSESLRRDGDSLSVTSFQANIGQSAVFVLEPLADASFTIRQTTEVVSIVKIV